MVEKINRIILSFVFFISVAVFSARLSYANGLMLINDTQTQKYLAHVVKPLFNAAKINFNENKIMIVGDDSLNAFVSDGNYLFVNTGTLISIDNTNELSGILAHETGHIMGGHIVRQKLKMQKIQYAMIGSMLAAGAAAVTTGRGDAAMAVILGSQSSALNSMLHHQVEEERSADESAVKLLNATKQSAKGLQRFMEKIRKHNTLSGIEEDAYFTTHPMTFERISHFKEVAKSNNFSQHNPLDSELKMVKAKISAFLGNRERVWRVYPKSATTDDAVYAHAVLYFRDGDIGKAMQSIDILLKKHPQNPYFHELKGQFLFETGKVKASIQSYRESLKLLDAPLTKLSLAHAVLESSPDKASLNEAITLLKQAQVTYPTPFGWELLSRAYGEADKPAESYYAAAEYNYSVDNLKSAKQQLIYAQKSNPDKTLLLKISDLKMRIKEEEN